MMHTVVDLQSKILDAPPPSRGSKFFQFHAVFGEIWQNRMLVPPMESWRPLLREILDPPLAYDVSPHVNRQTPVKTLPSRNFVCGRETFTKWYRISDLHTPHDIQLHHALLTIHT